MISSFSSQSAERKKSRKIIRQFYISRKVTDLLLIYNCLLYDKYSIQADIAHIIHELYSSVNLIAK